MIFFNSFVTMFLLLIVMAEKGCKAAAISTEMAHEGLAGSNRSGSELSRSLGTCNVGKNVF